MASKILLEEEVKNMKKHFGGLISLVKDLKAKVEKMMEKNEKQEIQDILEKQKVLEELLAANAKSIKQIEDEMREMRGKLVEPQVSKETDKDTDKGVEIKKCRYFNRGHCKFKLECRFSHPKEICAKILEVRKCEQHLCKMRHPKPCKWDQGRGGCRRQDCDYLHVTLACDDDHQSRAHKNYPCAGCKNCYDDITCVVEHTVKNTVFLLCLNCEDWIRRKDMVINPGWSLFDHNGDLRTDV